MPPVPRNRIEQLYRQIQAYRLNLTPHALSDLFTELYQETLSELRGFERVQLTTRIPNKRYFAFENEQGRISRAVNETIYRPDVPGWRRLVAALRADDLSHLSQSVLTRTVYSFAISFCAYIDVTRRSDQKTPGTFFEYLIGHLFASRLGVNPTKRLQVLNLDMNTTLPTDYVFDLGARKPKFHLPVKTSTRERVIQVWAHQRVLDGVYGTGRFLGTPTILAETKVDSVRREVVEICLPDQWRIYQMHIAQLARVYYLDVPRAYESLAALFPPIRVVPFGRFFLERDDLIAP